MSNNEFYTRWYNGREVPVDIHDLFIKALINEGSDNLGSPPSNAASASGSGGGGRMRRPVANIRRQNAPNKVTRLDKTGIHYYDEKMIGQGSTGVVYEGFHPDENRPSAIKRMKADNVSIWKNELDIWLRLGESSFKPETLHVVKLFTYVQWPEHNSISYYFAMELATVTLEEMIKQYQGCDLSALPDLRKALVKYLHGAGQGLSWIHGKRIIHRDIKPDNILIFTSPDGQDIAKVGDFGISKKITRDTSTGTNSMGRGTSDWMAPECIEALNNGESMVYSRSVDIFSFGMTAHYTMSLGEHPFENSTAHRRFKIMNIIDINVPPAQLSSEEQSANNIFAWMMNKISDRRPSISQVLNHPFFWDTKQNLNFIVDVARAFDDKKITSVIDLRQQIDNRYISVCGRWKIEADILQLLQQREGSNATKKYDPNSIMSLVELIRDKYVHSSNLKVELLQDNYFGKNGEFSEDKYMKFFLKVQPHLACFLYTYLSQPLPFTFINSFKRNHYMTGQTHIPLL